MAQPEEAPVTPIDFPFRAASIDIGSNAIRFTAAEFRGARNFVVLESLRVSVRLGHGAFLTNRLEPELIAQALEALVGFRRRMDALGIEHHRAVATSAVRESENGGELIARAEADAAIRIEPITGVEEGRLVWLAIRARVELSTGRWLLVDLGGGSLEVTLAESERRLWTRSLPVGTVRMLERVEKEWQMEDEGPERSARQRLEEYAAGVLADLPQTGLVQGVLATGGNAEALADLSGLPSDEKGVRRLEGAWLRETVDRLESLTLEERISRLGLRPDRADIIFPAAIVYARLAAGAGVEELIVPGVGLKEGVLLDLVDDLVGHEAHEAAAAHEVDEGALALGRRYRFDETHARQVTRFSLQLFDELREVHGLVGQDRRILLAAAMLHDSGKLIENRRHHKHSSYLIRNAELPGLASEEIELAALVARYHRGPTPKKEHDRYGALEKPDRKRVKKLSALLRVGDGLDQHHGQEIELLQVGLEADEITLHVRVAGGKSLEDWVFTRKNKLFEKVFDRRLRMVLA
jgi:exopolyphosphatase / guanosine-5'-triphosphate,3'-diphosphate pyrophosphatase